jgi:hypothetical protein
MVARKFNLRSGGLYLPSPSFISVVALDMCVGGTAVKGTPEQADKNPD